MERFFGPPAIKRKNPIIWRRGKCVVCRERRYSEKKSLVKYKVCSISCRERLIYRRAKRILQEQARRGIEVDFNVLKPPSRRRGRKKRPDPYMLRRVQYCRGCNKPLGTSKLKWFCSDECLKGGKG